MPATIDLARIWVQREADARLRTRMAILLHLAPSTVHRAAERLRTAGLAGLAVRREDNGRPAVDEAFLRTVRPLLRGPCRGLRPVARCRRRRPSWMSITPA
jgi:hypothetical protein